MRPKETQLMFSVVNGKVMRAMSTARVEVLPTECAAMLNALVGACREAQAAMQVLGYTPSQLYTLSGTIAKATGEL